MKIDKQINKLSGRNIKISIITVVKNDEIGLIKTYNSISEQILTKDKWEEIEWVVVDGNSIDGTIDFLRQIEINMHFIYNSQNDAGIFDAMNKGFRLSKGDYVIFLNAGDIFNENTTLHELLKITSNAVKLIIAGQVKLVQGNQTYVSNLFPWVCHQAVLTHRSILEKYEFDISKKYYGDLHLWMRLRRDHLFDVERHQLVISTFYLGGVGNRPENLWQRLIERNKLCKEYENGSKRFSRIGYTVLMIIVWKLFGSNFYYRISKFINQLKK